ncbi:MAG: tetratricopeptide repeat protein [Patescibacteria group bacterium]|nr:tetratricopeptide repeat protein [Patescibacteria group bacterium]
MRAQHRLLLDRVYVQRVEQLHGQSLTSEARAVLRKLLDMKPADPDTLGQIPRLRVIVGDSGIDAATVLEKEPSLLVSLADQAVLDPRSLAPHHGGVSGHVELIRKAFVAVEQGDDNAAAEALRSVPHNSPLGDWKLFLRGLSLFYAKEMDRAEANWMRLDPERPAFRIAQSLLVVDGRLSSSEAKVDVTRHLALLQTRLQTDPAAGPLRMLVQYWREEDYRPFFKEYRSFRQRFAKSHATLLAKIVELVWKYAVRQGDDDLLIGIKAIGPSPSLDPRWNLAWAMNEECDADDYDPSLEQAWLAYVEDIAVVPGLRDEERCIAVGLVYHRLAATLMRCAANADKPSFFRWERPERGASDKLRESAARYLRRAVESCPRLTAAYWDLARFHEQLDEPDKSAAVLRRLVSILPDDFEAHLWLANYYLGQTEPSQSATHVDAVLRLRPRDPQCGALRWNQRMANIRSLAAGRKFLEARRQIDEAAQVMREEDAEPFAIDVMRAALELRARKRDASDEYVKAAMQIAGEPAAVWLAMSATAAGFRVPRNVAKEYEESYKAALAARPTSRTAGLLARLVGNLKSAKQNYTGRATQERLALKYLARTTGIVWAEADLLAVCQLLGYFPKYARLRASLVAGGMRRFPDNGRLHYWDGVGELAAGGRRCRYSRVIQRLQRAITLLEASESPADRSLIQLAKNALSTAYEHRQRQEPWRDALDGKFDEYEDEDDDYEGADDDYEDEDEDEDDEKEDGEMDCGSREKQKNPFGGDDIDCEALERILGGLMGQAPPDVKASFKKFLDQLSKIESASR